MNRDEKRSRVAALPPATFKMGKRRVLYPLEPSGGTWLAINDKGLCLALINWHRIQREPVGRIESRGRVIPGLIAATDSRAVARRLRRMPLTNLQPFRLLVIDPQARRITEWRWNVAHLVQCRHGWQNHHWFSSGYDEQEAEKQRTAVCENWPLSKIVQLRALHASHLPQRGPFSICMHRPEATTVSYSEVVASAKRITLRYQPGAPCRHHPRVSRSISF